MYNKEYQRKYRLKHIQKLKEYHHNYFQSHKKQLQKKNRDWAIKNKEKVKLYMKKYFNNPKNKKKINTRVKKYSMKHPEIHRKAQKKWAKQNLQKTKGHSKAKTITLIKDTLCNLCKLNIAEHKHHPDYKQPLLVQFLCVDCHIKIHKELRKNARRK